MDSILGQINHIFPSPVPPPSRGTCPGTGVYCNMSIKRRRGREIYDRSIAIYEKPSRHNGAGSGRRGKGVPPEFYRPRPRRCCRTPGGERGGEMFPLEIRWFLFDLLILQPNFEKRNDAISSRKKWK